MSAPRCFPGRVLNKRYRLDEVVGRGAVATVWRGRDLQHDRPCAIKILNPATASDAAERRRLAREGALVSRLCHPNLPLMYAHDEDPDGTPFLVMELVAGRTLREFLRLRGRLSFEDASHLLRQIGSALTSMHAMGVLHRDLKPQNIVMGMPTDATGHTSDIQGAVIRVVDFGLAAEREVGRAASICAPLARDIEYRAPELQEAAGMVDARSDQWSLAVIAYELLAGVQPFHDTDPVHLALQIRDGRFTPLGLHRPELPAYVGAAIDRALSVPGHERFASVSEFIRALHGDWPRMFRIATPTTAVSAEADLAPPVEVLSAAGERDQPSRLRSPMRAAAVALLTTLAFAMPFSWVAGISSRRGDPRPDTADLFASRSNAPPVSSAALQSKEPSPIPPLRPADPLPATAFPPLRLQEQD